MILTFSLRDDNTFKYLKVFRFHPPHCHTATLPHCHNFPFPSALLCRVCVRDELKSLFLSVCRLHFGGVNGN